MAPRELEIIIEGAFSTSYGPGYQQGITSSPGASLALLYALFARPLKKRKRKLDLDDPAIVRKLLRYLDLTQYARSVSKIRR